MRRSTSRCSPAAGCWLRIYGQHGRCGASEPQQKYAHPPPASTPATPGTDTLAPLKKSTEGQLLDRIVAVVNDGVVLQSELDAQTCARSTAQLRGQNVALPPRPRCARRCSISW